MVKILPKKSILDTLIFTSKYKIKGSFKIFKTLGGGEPPHQKKLFRGGYVYIYGGS